MIFLLVKRLLDSGWLKAHNLDFLRVFTFVTFQATVSVLASFVFVLAGGSGVIDWLRGQKIKDAPNFDQDEVNRIMAHKRGVPTMGGILIIGAIAATTL